MDMSGSSHQVSAVSGLHLKVPWHCQRGSRGPSADRWTVGLNVPPDLLTPSMHFGPEEFLEG